MTRVVIDTNVLVSSAIKEQGVEAAVLDLVAAGHLTVCVSAPILVEYQEVLLRPRLKLDVDRVRHLLDVLRREAFWVNPVVRVSVSTDEADNRFLECAEECKAAFLITGNKRHFPGRWKKTVVVTAREFVELVASGEI